MLHLHASRFGWILGLTSWAVTAQAQGQEFRYHYVSLDQVELPPGFTSFVPSIIQNSGRVYGEVRNDSGDDNHIAFYENGALTVLQAADSFLMTTGNAGRTAFGGAVGPVGNQHAALLVGDELVPLGLPDEAFSFVTAINDPGTAIVDTRDNSGHATYRLYQHGQVSTLNFGTNVADPTLSLTNHVMNNNGIIAGTEGTPRFENGRAFRFDLRTGEVVVLQPLPDDTLSFGLSINARGDVLGYSFIVPSPSVPYHENIGVWDHKGNFTTYATEGISSNRLLFNDNNLIVITFITSTRTSYLVPEPGVRLDLATLVDSLPAGQDLFIIRDMNNHGDMIGTSSSGNHFLLERIPAMGR